MDLYNTATGENCDPLDILTPPVKRIHTLYSRNLPLEIVNFESNLFKGFCKTNSPAVETAAQPSTSLILKKTSQTRVLEQYSFTNYTNKDLVDQNKYSAHLKASPRNTRNKPLIKVTVIPRTNKNSKLQRKRRHVQQKVQNTASNQETFVQSNNVYLVVAGRKEKIFEIKTTGSADFRNPQITNKGQDEETHLEKVQNIKQLLRSLNMDMSERKRNDINRPAGNNLRRNDHTPVKTFQNECFCVDDVRPDKSRVRVYGHLGLTEDDRYVLKYGAMVDDKPVMPVVKKLIDEFSPNLISEYDERVPVSQHCEAVCNKSTNVSRNRRNSGVQADFKKVCGCQKQFNTDIFASKGTQGTQVNFNIELANTRTLKTDKPTTMDKKVQCSCMKVISDTSVTYEEEEVMGCQTPLVIISVYPKQNTPDAGKPGKPQIEIKRKTSPQKQGPINRKLIVNNTEKRSDGIERRDDQNFTRTARSRSGSPQRRGKDNPKSRIQDTKQVESKFTKPTGAKRPLSPKRTFNSKIYENDKAEQVIHQKSKLTPLRKQQTNIGGKMKLKETSTNTDHVQAKKALVENFTRSISTRMNQRPWNKPRVDTSRVSINIDGEKEHYNVLFNQDELTTDLSVRKTLKNVKNAGCQNNNYDVCYKRENSCNSLENLFLMQANKPKNRPMSSDLEDNQARASISKHVSGLTIRDSLEICHRREDKSTQGVKNTQTSSVANTNKQGNEFSAPIKHFIGDDCCVFDPMARDREIRQLLGVDRMRPSASKSQESHSQEKIDEVSFHYFFRKNCRSDLKGLERGNSSRQLISETTSTKYIQQNIDAAFHMIPSQCNQNAPNEKSILGRASLYQQLILNRNIQVFLQVEQFTKQKPITLTRKQYEKVRRTIQRTISKNISNHRKKNCRVNSEVSVGEVKKKKKTEINLLCDKQVQTEVTTRTKGFNCIEGGDAVEAVKDTAQKTHLDKRTHRRHKTKEIKLAMNNVHKSKDLTIGSNSLNRSGSVDLRRTASSMEVRYANVPYGRHVTFSSTGKFVSNTRLERKTSFFTIFRGHKKSPTPNLGTSEYSLYSEKQVDEKSIKVLMKPREPPARKPLLRRLMSCLVMRSTRESEVKVHRGPTPDPKTVESSIDSYYISSSLAAAEVSSSIYDTTASFYSNHTIYPVNSKIKRGFFSSVRGFLSNRRS